MSSLPIPTEVVPLLATKDGAKGGNDYSHDKVEYQDAEKSLELADQKPLNEKNKLTNFME